MHCGFNLTNWRAPYDFIPLFMISTILITLSSSLLEPKSDDFKYFLCKCLATISGGLIFDYIPSKTFLVLIYISGLSTGFMLYSQAIVSGMFEVFTFTYICEVVIDNCKFLALSEIIALKLVSNSIGGLFHSIPSFSCFFPATCLVLLIINLSIFREVIKTHRPLFAGMNELSVIPRPFGVFICFLVLFTEGAQNSLLKSILSQNTKNLFTFSTIFLVPVSFFLIFRFLSFQKVSFVLLIFLVTEVVIWNGFLWEYSEYLTVIVTVVTSAYSRCAGLVLLSRVLGPYYNGKFFGFGLAFQHIFNIFLVEDWMTGYFLGLALGLASVACLAPGMKYCEYHRDYVIGHTHAEGTSGKASKYKLKLQRASILEN
jgi:hypothetical protein